METTDASQYWRLYNDAIAASSTFSSRLPFLVLNGDAQASRCPDVDFDPGAGARKPICARDNCAGGCGLDGELKDGVHNDKLFSNKKKFDRWGERGVFRSKVALKLKVVERVCVCVRRV